MSNIKENNFNNHNLKIYNINYYDYFLSNDNNINYIPDGTSLYDSCLISSIDLNSVECIDSNNILYSKSEYYWENAINNNVIIADIGLTGLDNGFIKYYSQDNNIIELFTTSTLSLINDDKRLILNPINGYIHNLQYNTELSNENNIKYISFNGGFYQGFFKLYGYNYQVLPISPDKEFAWEFVIRPTNRTIDKNTINYFYPNNSGFFFYIGLRAENKFWYYARNNALDSSYNEVISGNTSSFDYILTSDQKKTTTEVEFNNANTIEIVTDNKFLLFDRTYKPGHYTADNFDPNKTYVITEREKRDKENYYLMLDRTGRYGRYTADTLPDNIKYNNDINIYSDTYKNSIGFRIKDDGSIGYRYLIKNCDITTNILQPFIIKEEYSIPGIININKWNHIIIRYITDSYNNVSDCVNKTRKCKLQFYSNGVLKFISQELDEFDLHELNELKEKQEGVAYNISLGGGTQGLLESLLLGLPDMSQKLALQYSIDGITNWHNEIIKEDYYFRYSVDGENNWSEQILYKGASIPEVLYQYSNGNLNEWHTPPNNNDVYYRYTVNDGIAWSDPITFNINNPPTIIFQYSANGADNWHNIVMDNDWYYQYSFDSGTTWNNSILYNGLTTNQFFIRFSIDGTDMWHEERGIDDSYYEYTLNGGITWYGPFIFNNASPYIFQFRYSQDGNSYWHSDFYINDSYCQFSDDGGDTWSFPFYFSNGKNLTGVEFQYSPDSINNWNSFISPDSQYFKYSVDGGNNWSIPILFVVPIKRYTLPLEENFCGTFIGDIMAFNFHNCQFGYTKVLNNYLYYKKILNI
jgi:hypothetical protein